MYFLRVTLLKVIVLENDGIFKDLIQTVGLPYQFFWVFFWRF